MKSTRKNIIQPDDLWDAVEAQMARDGEPNRSRWIGEAIAAQLDDDLSETLSERPAANRPRKGKDDEYR